MSFNNQQSQEEEERGGREAQVKYEKGRTSPLAARQVPESTMRKERLAVRARHHQTGSRTEYWDVRYCHNFMPYSAHTLQEVSAF